MWSWFSAHWSELALGAGVLFVMWSFDSHQTTRYRLLSARLERLERAVQGLALMHGGPSAHARLLDEKLSHRIEADSLAAQARADIDEFLSRSLGTR